ncbi:GFA family protein [Desulfosarcina sp.]|uniref:GFA family protein n=1 Tax=Desulfosarcina sp. TaxID=2027861 RepID=UPI0035633FF4
MKNGFGPDYASVEDKHFKSKYRARCHCGKVQYDVCADPLDAKICHCLSCQKLHGAPMQWAAIFRKRDIRITAGTDHVRFFNSERLKYERILPCKVSCGCCGTLIADEGRRMWLAFPSLFEFGHVSKVPTSFKPTCHIFYSLRVVDINDDLPKWSGHKGSSKLL